MGKALLAVASWAALVAGCASVERRIPSPEAPLRTEVLSGELREENWKARCLYAHSCATGTAPGCIERLSALATSDQDERIRACAIEALASVCAAGGRAILAKLSWERAQGPSPVARAFADAVLACPSADAVLSLATTENGAFQSALQTLVPGRTRTLPSDRLERVAYLEDIARLPEPRSQTETVLQEVRDIAPQRAGDEAAVTIKEAADEDDYDQRQSDARESLQKAADALQERDVVVAASYLTQAEKLGADVTTLRQKVERLKPQLATEHIARGWQFVRLDKPSEAELELRQAGVLGGWDQRLDDAIANSPTRRAEEREKEAWRERVRKQGSSAATRPSQQPEEKRDEGQRVEDLSALSDDEFNSTTGTQALLFLERLNAHKLLCTSVAVRRSPFQALSLASAASSLDRARRRSVDEELRNRLGQAHAEASLLLSRASSAQTAAAITWTRCGEELAAVLLENRNAPPGSEAWRNMRGARAAYTRCVQEFMEHGHVLKQQSTECARSVESAVEAMRTR